MPPWPTRWACPLRVVCGEFEGLRQSGVIDRIAAILNPAKTGRTLKAVVTVELRLHGEPNTRQFLNLAAREEAVAQAYAVTGEVDAVLILRLRGNGGI